MIIHVNTVHITLSTLISEANTIVYKTNITILPRNFYMVLSCSMLNGNCDISGPFLNIVPHQYEGTTVKIEKLNENTS
jgi:hypothetical protein